MGTRSDRNQNSKARTGLRLIKSGRGTKLPEWQIALRAGQWNITDQMHFWCGQMQSYAFRSKEHGYIFKISNLAPKGTDLIWRHRSEQTGISMLAIPRDLLAKRASTILRLVSRAKGRREMVSPDKILGLLLLSSFLNYLGRRESVEKLWSSKTEENASQQEICLFNVFQRGA